MLLERYTDALNAGRTLRRDAVPYCVATYGAVSYRLRLDASTNQAAKVMTKEKRRPRVLKRRSTSRRERPTERGLRGLPNLGPKSALLLARSGISSVKKLLEVGSIPAYVAAKRAGENVSLNFLWALEGALTGLHWREVARQYRTSLLLALEDFERGPGPNRS